MIPKLDPIPEKFRNPDDGRATFYGSQGLTTKRDFKS